MTSLIDIMSPDLCKHNVEGGSQKKIFEKLSKCISTYIDHEDTNEIFQALLEREHLGSTALGHGIAIPHCRLPGTSQMFGCLFHLENSINFDAHDNQKVDLIFALIAPEEAHQEHLDILAQLAEYFQDRRFCQQLRHCSDANELYQSCISYSTNVS